jgi:hypothetical protein
MRKTLASLLLLVSTSCLALQPADVQITTDPAVSVRVTRRAGNTSKTVDITVNKQDKVTVVPIKPTPPPVTPPHTDHHAGIPVTGDASTWPKGDPGVNTFVYTQTWVEGPGVPGHWEQAYVTPGPVPSPEDWEHSGDVRTVVSYTHMSYDDPIVYPGQPGMAHHHTFYHPGTDAFLTVDKLRTNCLSTSRGGTMNCSAYWNPSLIDTTTGNPWAPKVLLVYYKDGNRIYMGRPDPRGGTEGDHIQPFPKGLVMIAGNASATTPEGLVQYTCMVPAQGFGRPGFENQSTIPACLPGEELWAKIPFPQCWDGVNLDSPNHKSHMAYPSNDLPGSPPGRSWGCPATHPVLIPQVTFFIIYTIPDQAAADRLKNSRWSSDVYSGPAGYSLHGDWENGWDEDVMKALWTNCWMARRNCGSFDLGDGRGAGSFGSN